MSFCNGSRDIANEILQDYPEVAKFYDYKLKSISFATIFTGDNGRGGGLVPRGLLRMDKDEEEARRYWVP